MMVVYFANTAVRAFLALSKIRFLVRFEMIVLANFFRVLQLNCCLYVFPFWQIKFLEKIQMLPLSDDKAKLVSVYAFSTIFCKQEC